MQHRHQAHLAPERVFISGLRDRSLRLGLLMPGLSVGKQTPAGCWARLVQIDKVCTMRTWRHRDDEWLGLGLAQVLVALGAAAASLGVGVGALGAAAVASLLLLHLLLPCRRHL